MVAKPMPMMDLPMMQGTKTEVKILLLFNRNSKVLTAQACAQCHLHWRPLSSFAPRTKRESQAKQGLFEDSRYIRGANGDDVGSIGPAPFD